MTPLQEIGKIRLLIKDSCLALTGVPETSAGLLFMRENLEKSVPHLEAANTDEKMVGNYWAEALHFAGQVKVFRNAALHERGPGA